MWLNHLNFTNCIRFEKFLSRDNRNQYSWSDQNFNNLASFFACLVIGAVRERMHIYLGWSCALNIMKSLIIWINFPLFKLIHVEFRKHLMIKRHFEISHMAMIFEKNGAQAGFQTKNSFISLSEIRNYEFKM